MSIKWRISSQITYLFFKYILGLRVFNRELVPRAGRIILCPNHKSYWDPPLIGATSPREVFFLAKEDLFTSNRLFGWLIRQYNAIPIKRETSGLSAFRKALELLQEERAVVIFPEGTRNKTPAPLLPLKEGAALLAQKTSSPLVPAFIEGNGYNVWDWILRKSKLKIYFGKPIYVYNFPEGKEGIKMLTQELSSALLKLRN